MRSVNTGEDLQVRSQDAGTPDSNLEISRLCRFSSLRCCPSPMAYHIAFFHRARTRSPRSPSLRTDRSEEELPRSTYTCPTPTAAIDEVSSPSDTALTPLERLSSGAEHVLVHIMR
eukprot:1156942-Rhodomonas_salina.1